MEWGEKSYLGPAEIESFVYCFRKNLGESKGSSRRLAFMVLVLIKGVRRRGQLSFPFVTQGGLRASPLTYRN